MPVSGEQARTNPEGHERAFFNDRVRERDRILDEVLGKYDQTAGRLAKDYAGNMEWLSTNPQGFNEADFTDATTSIAADTRKLMGGAGGALEEMLLQSTELQRELTGDDAELFGTLLAHAQKPTIGSMHESVRVGFSHFSSPSSEMTARAAFDSLRLTELKVSAQRLGADSRGVQLRLQEFSTSASRQAASALLDEMRLETLFTQARDKGAETISPEQMARMSSSSLGILTTVALDGLRFSGVKKAAIESRQLGLGDALAAMRIEHMSCQPVKDIAFCLISKHFEQRKPGVGDRRRTTWLGPDWETSDPWGQQARYRQRARSSASSGGSSRQGSSHRQSSSSSGYSGGSGRSRSSSQGGQSRAAGREQPSDSSSERKYDIDPNRKLTTPEERVRAEDIRNRVSRTAGRQYGWFKNEGVDTIVDIVRVVEEIRSAKGNEGIRDRKVYTKIRQMAEVQHNNPSHPSHTWAQLMDAMLNGRLGKDAKLPF